MKGGVSCAILASVLWLLDVSHTGLCSDNLALHKPALMSPYNHGEVALDAREAVDGEVSQSYPNTVCVHSVAGDPKPWVIVDLLKEYYISHLFLVNRRDCCYRFHDFIVDVFTKNPYRCAADNGTVCYTQQGVLWTEGTVHCNKPVLGRFVRIWKPIVTGPNDVLNFCEMEVYGLQEALAPECSPSSFPITKHTGKRLVSNNVTTLSVSTRAACVIECKRFGACVGGNYNTENGVCELLTRPEYSTMVSEDSAWLYFGNDFC